jgi:hypothetical protein
MRPANPPTAATGDGAIVDDRVAESQMPELLVAEESAQEVRRGIQSSIDVTVRITGLPRMWLLGIHHEYPSRAGSVPGSEVVVRLNT